MIFRILETGHVQELVDFYEQSGDGGYREWQEWKFHARLIFFRRKFATVEAAEAYIESVVSKRVAKKLKVVKRLRFSDQGKCLTP